MSGGSAEGQKSMKEIVSKFRLWEKSGPGVGERRKEEGRRKREEGKGNSGGGAEEPPAGCRAVRRKRNERRSQGSF